MTVSINYLPKYTRYEEVANSSTHFLGSLFSLGVLVFFIVFQAINAISFTYMIPFYIYVLFLGVMFTISGVYHSRPFGSKARAIFRVIDHSDIYFCIAGTYTPLCMHAIANTNIGYILLGVNWGLCILGALLNLVKTDKFIVSLISYILYIVCGWLVMIVYPFNLGIPVLVFLFILLGGILYSIGAILYAIGRKKKWLHTIFHIFVLLGAVTQFIGVYFILVIS